DIYFLNQHGTTALYRNKGDGTFEDVTAKAGVGLDSRVSVGATFADYDNDGNEDLFVTTTRAGNTLFHNRGDGTFEAVTAKAGMRGGGWAGDVAVFDYDDDGFLDVFVPSMFGRCQLYHNNRDGTFTDVTATTLGPTPHGAIGAKVFDYDGDGRLDLFVVDMHSDMWMGLDSRHSSEKLA